MLCFAVFVAFQVTNAAVASIRRIATAANAVTNRRVNVLDSVCFLMLP